MPAAWRITKKKHAAKAFSGEGAAKTGGRWNSRGTWVIYTSGTKALAALESLVHLNPPVFFEYVAFRIEFAEDLVEKWSLSRLPANWSEEPPPPSTKKIGDIWVKEARSAILELPSVIISGETNYLLNPSHPDFPEISIAKPESFAFDPRLIRGRK